MSKIEVNVELQRKGFALNCDLDIPGNGVTTILGPSGSGKTTLLRLIAGLERPDHGCIRVNRNPWVDSTNSIFLSPQKRRVGMVFQDYALFDHLTVAQNIGYGLNRQGRQNTVNTWLKRLHLQSLADRYPHQLSGGQRQRVAFARALAPEPDILLLDEPFSAIDAPLREKLRIQLEEIVGLLNQPVMMVTHDLDEARYLADHIGVMIDGKIHRFGLTARVFDDPGSYEVARILGWRNFLSVRSFTKDAVRGDWGELPLRREISVETDWLAIRPYHVRIANEHSAGLDVVVTKVRELGSIREMECRLKDGTVLVMQSSWHEPLLAPGSELKLQLPLQHLRTLGEGYQAQFRHKKTSMSIAVKEITYPDEIEKSTQYPEHEGNREPA